MSVAFTCPFLQNVFVNVTGTAKEPVLDELPFSVTFTLIVPVYSPTRKLESMLEEDTLNSAEEIFVLVLGGETLKTAVFEFESVKVSVEVVVEVVMSKLGVPVTVKVVPCFVNCTVEGVGPVSVTAALARFSIKTSANTEAKTENVFVFILCVIISQLL